MKPWLGRWLIAVSALHTVVGVAMFSEVLVAIFKRGVFDTVGTDPLTGAVVWFLLFGAPLFICGLAIAELERSPSGQVPRAIGWSLLGLTLLGVTLMPVSGFWLAFPPAIAILLRKSDVPARRQPAAPA